MASSPASPSPAPLRLIVGLGNPGRDYERTRHNVGFMVLDRLAAKTSGAGSEWRVEKSWKAAIATPSAASTAPALPILCKPLDFMNRSGGPFQAVCRFYKIRPVETLVVYDDLALPLGRLRLRPEGSAGGHNGMASILEAMGMQAIPRLRIGIGNASPGGMVGHVLGHFASGELPLLEAALDHALQAIEKIRTAGFTAAMNQFNVAKN